MNQNPFSIRRIDLKEDLGQVADLIAQCFDENMDPDGRRFLDFLRSLAKDRSSLLRVLNDPLRAFSPLDGFICRVDERLVGNISITPFKNGYERICFVSNVAVHPDFRLHGMATSLIREVEEFAKKSGFTSVWLQVRKDNEIARHLYNSIDYQERASRTSWVSTKLPKHDIHSSSTLTFKPRRTQDWRQQESWLNSNYPATITWQLELRSAEFSPKIIQSISNTLSGRRYQHISIWQGAQLYGVLTWQSSFRFADPLWLAVPQDGLALVVKEAIPYMQNYLMTKKPLIINLEDGMGEDVFLNGGFERLHTLIWMQKQL